MSMIIIMYLICGSPSTRHVIIMWTYRAPAVINITNITLLVTFVVSDILVSTNLSLVCHFKIETPSASKCCPAMMKKKPFD